MSKRMQVLVDEHEYALIKKASARRHMTTAEWVRQTLRAQLREQPLGHNGKKLAALARATTHAFPAPDIEQMLAEIERGYGV